MKQHQGQAYCPLKSQTSYLADITSEIEFEWLSSFVNSSVWVN